MGKIESGKIVLNEDRFSFPEFVNGVIAIVQPQARAKNLSLDITVGTIQQETVIGDSMRMNQALINLVSNALKYTPDGGSVRLSLSEGPSRRPGCRDYRFVVQDTGLGMSPEFIERLFDPFEREESDMTERIEGTGLGMAITKKLVDQMHGSLDVESEPGKGSTFILRLSLPVGECPANAPDPMEEKRAPDLKGLHLLLAEDNELNAEIAVTLLEEQGAKITAVTNGKEALEAIQNAAPRTYDAILMDVMMPDERFGSYPLHPRV